MDSNLVMVKDMVWFVRLAILKDLNMASLMVCLM